MFFDSDSHVFEENGLKHNYYGVRLGSQRRTTVSEDHNTNFSPRYAVRHSALRDTASKKCWVWTR